MESLEFLEIDGLNFPNVQILHLYQCYITCDSVEPFKGRFPSVQQLYIEDYLENFSFFCQALSGQLFPSLHTIGAHSLPGPTDRVQDQSSIPSTSDITEIPIRTILFDMRDDIPLRILHQLKAKLRQLRRLGLLWWMSPNFVARYTGVTLSGMHALVSLLETVGPRIIELYVWVHSRIPDAKSCTFLHYPSHMIQD